MLKESDAASDKAERGGAPEGAEAELPAGAEGGPTAVQPMVRKNFADTAYWAAAILTDKEGHAEIALNMPENLTGWKVKAWAMGHGTKVGQGETEIVLVECHWAGGTRTRHDLRRPVARLTQLSDHAPLLARIRGLHAQGRKAPAIAIKARAKGLRRIGPEPFVGVSALRCQG